MNEIVKLKIALNKSYFFERKFAYSGSKIRSGALEKHVSLTRN
jgi:hypothetical protein